MLKLKSWFDFQGKSKRLYAISDQYSPLLKLDVNGFLLWVWPVLWSTMPPVFYHPFPLFFLHFSRNCLLFQSMKNFHFTCIGRYSSPADHRTCFDSNGCRITYHLIPNSARGPPGVIPYMGHRCGQLHQTFCAAKTLPPVWISLETVSRIGRPSDSPLVIKMRSGGQPEWILSREINLNALEFRF